MFSKPVLAALALAFVAFANPVPGPGGISIPLQKRHTLTKADGSFDHEAAIRDNIKTHKYV